MFINNSVERDNKHTVFLTLLGQTGVPDDAKMRQEKETEEQEDSKNKARKERRNDINK